MRTHDGSTALTLRRVLARSITHPFTCLQLWHSELTEALTTRVARGSIDVVVAAGVLVYFGDLAPFFAAAAAALRPVRATLLASAELVAPGRPALRRSGGRSKSEAQSPVVTIFRARSCSSRRCCCAGCLLLMALVCLPCLVIDGRVARILLFMTPLPGRLNRPGGLIAFSTEELESASCPFSGKRLGERDRGKAYHLQRSGRFAHHKAYVLDTLATHGFSGLDASGRGKQGHGSKDGAGGGDAVASYFHYERAPIRKESAVMVSGHYVVAQRL